MPALGRLRGSSPARPGGLTFSYGDNHIDGYSYDSAGNLLNDGNHSYAYDAENRLISIDSGATTYVYDAEGRRIAKQQGGVSTREFLYDLEGNAMTEIQPSTGWVHSDVFGGGKLWATINWYTTEFHTSDWLGTRRLDTDNCGSKTYGYQSLPFGDGLQTVTFNQPCTGANTPDTERHFTGKERDSESNLDYFGARHYASSIGRFMSPDWSPMPVAVPYAELGIPQSLNLYSYTKNNPTVLTDPNGHCDIDGEHHGWAWCAAHALGLTETQKEQADQARANLSAMNGLYIDGKPAAEWARSASNQQAIGAERDLVNTLTEGSYWWNWFNAGAGAAAIKPINLPAWKDIAIDMDHIDSSHTAGGSRAIQSGQKDLFPSNWTREQREAAIREAYRNSKVAGASQGDRVFLEGQGGGLNIQMWVNKATATVESAWPK